MRSSLLALMIAVGFGHWLTPVRPPTTIGTAIFAIRVEGRALIIRRLPGGDCAVDFGGDRLAPLDPAAYCVL